MKTHISEMHFDGRNLMVRLHTESTRHVAIEVGPNDHPLLAEAWAKFTEAVDLAVQEAVLDIVGLKVPDTPPLPEKKQGVCRICDKHVCEDDEGAVFDGPKVYCGDHAPGSHG